MARKQPLVVVSKRGDLPATDGLEVVTADEFLAGDRPETRRSRSVVNLCRSLRYLSKGYYVSLLADARGQHVIPEIDTIRGLGDPYVLFRALQEAQVPTVDVIEMRERRRALPKAILPADEPGDGQRSTIFLREEKNDVPVYRPANDTEVTEAVAFFGQTTDPRFRRHAAATYREWPAPILRLRLLREEDEWKVTQVAPVPVHRLRQEDVRQLIGEIRTGRFLSRWWTEDSRDVVASIAVLYDENDPKSPSTVETVDRLQRIASRRDVHVQPIGPADLGRIGDHDALFIRAYTALDQPAFQFALRAEALGMPVVDDTASIIRCTNKVFLHELLDREGLATPKTAVVTPHTRYEALERLGLPFVVKLPDGSFSSAVHKVESRTEFDRVAQEMFRQSPLLIAQQYLPTDFDWRVTVLDGKVLFVARYFMARGHWQIQTGNGGSTRYGRVEAVKREYAPRDVIQVACRAASLIGNGLYGVDLKETKNGILVIEINDNPNLETGYEDAADGDRIYEELIDFFLRRIDEGVQPERRRPGPRPQRRKKELLRPIGRVPASVKARRHYRAFEVCGIELEYVVVNRDLNVLPVVESLFRELRGQPTSGVDMGQVGLSNELVDHVLEIKTQYPTHSLARSEDLLVEGLQRITPVLRSRFQARLLPTGMHPWLDPKRTRLWRRSGRRIYETYERIFDTETHGWRNVQACHVNLPFGLEHETVAMLNASALLLPYLPVLAASSPLVDGDLGPCVDNRLHYLLKLQKRIPESCGDFLPEYVSSLKEYRQRILRPMYAAVDRLPRASAIRAEFLNARGAILRFNREALELRLLDMQECVRMDLALAVFARSALKALTDRVLTLPEALPDHSLLVRDLHATVRKGSNARVTAPHLDRPVERASDGTVPVKVVLEWLFDLAEKACRKDEVELLELARRILAAGSLSERIARALEPYDDDAFDDAARRIYVELSDCLETNEPWKGRW